MTQSSPTGDELLIPEDDFSVVKDVERNFIVDSGRHSDMLEKAKLLNTVYQSTAYRTVKWIDGRIW